MLTHQEMSCLLDDALREINQTYEENFPDDFEHDDMYEAVRTLCYLTRRLERGPIEPPIRHAVIRLLMECQSHMTAFRHEHFAGDPPYESETNVHKVIDALVDTGKEAEQ